MERYYVVIPMVASRTQEMRFYIPAADENHAKEILEDVKENGHEGYQPVKEEVVRVIDEEALYETDDPYIKGEYEPEKVYYSLIHTVDGEVVSCDASDNLVELNKKFFEIAKTINSEQHYLNELGEVEVKRHYQVYDEEGRLHALILGSVNVC